MTESLSLMSDAAGSNLDAVWTGFRPGAAQYDACVAEVVTQQGYAEADVHAQLAAVAERCSSAVLTEVLRRERATAGSDTWVEPQHVLVLAAAGVPGVAIDAICCALFLGATVTVRPSRDEVALHHWLQHLNAAAPEFAARVHRVDVPEWSAYDAAIVFGSDETVALVRGSLPGGAHIAAYGTRIGCAVIGATAARDADAAWVTALADDVMTFGQRGCMSPSTIYVAPTAGTDSDDDANLTAAAALLEPALAAAYERHVTEHQRDRNRYTARQLEDDAFFTHAPKGMVPVAPRPRTVTVDGHTLRTLRVESPSGLRSGALTLVALGDAGFVATPAATRQTLVIAAEPGSTDATALADRAAESGFTRVCSVGEAHSPDALWAHDGIGRLAPLCRG